jgi:hypothetical protein
MNNTSIDYDNFLNPDYGTGVFRRRIRLTGSNDKVFAELEDTNHGFRAHIYHDGIKVTAVEGEAIRFPLSTCGGAIEPIKALTGTPLNSPAKDITVAVDPRANCTHLYDLAVLAIGHCSRGESVRQYDLEVDDPVGDEAAESRAYCNGELILSWQVKEWALTEGPHTGKPLYKGFSAWANEAFSGDKQEAAFALQKAYFVSQARRYKMDALAGTPANDQAAMNGVCFSYSPPNIDKAIRNANKTRDFSDFPERLLKFI